MPANQSRFGQINGQGDDRAMFLKIFGGEVFSAFYAKNVVIDKHYVRTINSGKSASFPMFGVGPDAEYHVPGTDIEGQVQNDAEQIITVDDFLIAHRAVGDIDEALSHYETRSILSQDCGYQLSRAFDTNVLRTGILAARSANPVQGEPGGTTLTVAGAKTSGIALADAILDAGRVMDEKECPEDGRVAYVRPLQYQKLVREAKDYMDTRLNPETNGSLKSGKIYTIGGIDIVKTNRLPSTNVVAGPKVKAKYAGDFSKTSCLIMQREAVGTVKLLDIVTETERQLRRLNWLIVSRMLLGHGVLRPQCAVEIADTV